MTGGHWYGKLATINRAMVNEWVNRAVGHVSAAPEGHVAALVDAAVNAGALQPVGDGTSDGYHTIGELYYHRALLTAGMFQAWNKPLVGVSAYGCYRSLRHHEEDSDPMFEGMFKVGAFLPTGEISYHYPVEHWALFGGVQKLDRAPKFDGYDAAESARRLQAFLLGDW